MKRALIIGVPTLVVLALALALLPVGYSSCDHYGGFRRGGNWSGAMECKCLGVKHTIQDQAPVDGFTVRKCLGIVTSKTCMKSVAGKIVRESC